MFPSDEVDNHSIVGLPGGGGSAGPIRIRSQQPARLATLLFLSPEGHGVTGQQSAARRRSLPHLAAGAVPQLR
jgi:hypothetical protein